MVGGKAGQGTCLATAGPAWKAHLQQDSEQGFRAASEVIFPGADIRLMMKGLRTLLPLMQVPGLHHNSKDSHSWGLFALTAKIKTPLPVHAQSPPPTGLRSAHSWTCK